MAQGFRRPKMPRGISNPSLSLCSSRSFWHLRRYILPFINCMGLAKKASFWDGFICAGKHQPVSVRKHRLDASLQVANNPEQTHIRNNSVI